MIKLDLPYGKDGSTKTVMLPESASEDVVISETIIDELAALPELDKQLPAHILQAVKAKRDGGKPEVLSVEEVPEVEADLITEEDIEAGEAEVEAEEQLELTEPSHKGNKHKGNKGKH